MDTIIGVLEFLYHALLVVAAIVMVCGAGLLWLINFEAKENERIKVERKKLDEQSKNEWEAFLEEGRRKILWERDAPLREAQQRERRERAEAEQESAWQAHHAKMRPVIKAAIAAGVDVCKDCSTVNPDRCSYQGCCNAWCSCSCAEDEARRISESDD